MMQERNSLKNELLREIEDFNRQEQPGPHPPQIDILIEKLIPHSLYPAPTSTRPAITGSWLGLYARYGSGTSKGRSDRDKSDLSLQSFKAFPAIPIDIIESVQEIGEDPPSYNNIIFFRSIETATEGYIVVCGTWMPDPDNPKRFNVVFSSAELKTLSGASAEELKAGLGLPSDAPLHRDFKPARFWSDVVYLDEDNRVNFGGMGGTYVLARREAPAITLVARRLADQAGQV